MNIPHSPERQLAERLLAPSPRRSLTVIVPVYNDAAAIPACAAAVQQALAGSDIVWQVLWIDDGCTDASPSVLAQLVDGEPQRHRVLTLARNFGKDVALTAGLDFADGDAVVPLDVDLQDPPELIPAMIAAWRSGADVVNAQRRSRVGDGVVKRLCAAVFYRMMAGPLHVRLPHDVGDFRLIDRRVINVLVAMRERTRFFKGMVAWPGFSSVVLTYQRPPRRIGRSTWSLWRLWNYALDGVTSSSSAPLRIWTYIGLLVSGSSIIYGLALVIRKLVWGADVPGYTSIMAAMLFLGGVQLIGLGVLGEYIGRIFEESKGRPLYVVSAMRGIPVEA